MMWRDLRDEGTSLFSKKSIVDSLHQDIAENFYPERANFTAKHTIGEEFGTYLYSSYPLIARRELGNALSTMSRPQGQKWFHMGLEDEDREDQSAKQWMQQKTDIQRRIIYNTQSRFVRAMKEADHDWATFGQAAISVELNRRRDGLFYRDWHLRDMAWAEGWDGKVDRFWRKWKPTNWQLQQYFGKDALHPDCNKSDNKNKETNVMHIFVPGDYCDNPAKNVSYYIDMDHEHVIEEKPMVYGYYVLPRWVTVSDSQYAYSPAVICALPDGRLYQDITRILLEAGQRAVDPPMVVVEDQLKSSMDLQAGGVTVVSATFDRRLGEVMTPVKSDKSGLGFGLEMNDRTQAMLAKAFYLDKLDLPRGQEMTAYEAGIRYQEYIRAILPIFEPKEQEMEGGVMELTFDILFRHGAFGSVQDIPQSLQGQSPQFKFVSPLSKAIEEKDANLFNEVVQVMAQAREIDPMAVSNININKASRDAVLGTGASVDWLNDEDQVLASQNAARQQQQAAQELELTQQAKEVMQ